MGASPLVRRSRRGAAGGKRSRNRGRSRSSRCVRPRKRHAAPRRGSGRRGASAPGSQGPLFHFFCLLSYFFVLLIYFFCLARKAAGVDEAPSRSSSASMVYRIVCQRPAQRAVSRSSQGPLFHFFCLHIISFVCSYISFVRRKASSASPPSPTRRPRRSSCTRAKRTVSKCAAPRSRATSFGTPSCR